MWEQRAPDQPPQNHGRDTIQQDREGAAGRDEKARGQVSEPSGLRRGVLNDKAGGGGEHSALSISVEGDKQQV